MLVSASLSRAGTTGGVCSRRSTVSGVHLLCDRDVKFLGGKALEAMGGFFRLFAESARQGPRGSTGTSIGGANQIIPRIHQSGRAPRREVGGRLGGRDDHVGGRPSTIESVGAANDGSSSSSPTESCGRVGATDHRIGAGARCIPSRCHSNEEEKSCDPQTFTEFASGIRCVDDTRCQTPCRTPRGGRCVSRGCTSFGRMVDRSTIGFTRCHRIWGSAVCGPFESADLRRSRELSEVRRLEPRHVNGVKHGAMRGQSLWTVALARFDREARYGLRGVRIGEASHPGPPKQFSRCRSRSRDISLAGIYLLDSDSESDEEPWVSGPSRPGLRRSGSPDESRNVAPRVDHGDPGETVLWIPQKAQGGPTVPEDDWKTANRFVALREPEEDSAQAESPGLVVLGWQGIPSQCRRGCG